MLHSVCPGLRVSQGASVALSFLIHNRYLGVEPSAPVEALTNVFFVDTGLTQNLIL